MAHTRSVWLSKVFSHSPDLMVHNRMSPSDDPDINCIPGKIEGIDIWDSYKGYSNVCGDAWEKGRG